jgi:hypothetical protein
VTRDDWVKELGNGQKSFDAFESMAKSVFTWRGDKGERYCEMVHTLLWDDSGMLFKGFSPENGWRIFMNASSIVKQSEDLSAKTKVQKALEKRRITLPLTDPVKIPVVDKNTTEDINLSKLLSCVMGSEEKKSIDTLTEYLSLGKKANPDEIMLTTPVLMLSKNPWDILYASTGNNFTSCTDLSKDRGGFGPGFLGFIVDPNCYVLGLCRQFGEYKIVEHKEYTLKIPKLSMRTFYFLLNIGTSKEPSIKLIHSRVYPGFGPMGGQAASDGSFNKEVKAVLTKGITDIDPRFVIGGSLDNLQNRGSARGVYHVPVFCTPGGRVYIPYRDCGLSFSRLPIKAGSKEEARKILRDLHFAWADRCFDGSGCYNCLSEKITSVGDKYYPTESGDGGSFCGTKSMVDYHIKNGISITCR